MENKGSNIVFKYVAMLLLILLVVLGGLFIYDKMFSNDKDVEMKDSKLLDLSKLEKYKNYDDTYGTMESLVYQDSQTGVRYTINLGMDGKVYSGNYASRIYINGVSEVVDIVDYSDGPGGMEVQQCYMLTDSGDVYLYKISDLMSGMYEATKIDKVSKVERIIEFSYGAMENAGSVWGIMAITRDGEYVEIARASV